MSGLHAVVQCNLCWDDVCNSDLVRSIIVFIFVSGIGRIQGWIDEARMTVATITDAEKQCERNIANATRYEILQHVVVKQLQAKDSRCK